MNNQAVETEKPRSMQKLSLGVSVVNYFSHASIAELLRSLQVFAGSNQILVTIVDNSQDASKHELEQLGLLATSASIGSLDVEVLAADRNLGYGAGNNLGVKRLLERGANVLWVLNPDIKVNGTASGMLQEVARSKASLWSTTTVEDARHSCGLGVLNTLTGGAKRSFKQTTYVSKFAVCYPGGHSIVLLAETWNLLNGFDEDYFLFMEEADLTMRSEALGIVQGTLSSVVVYHDQGLTTGTTNVVARKSETAFLESTKSRIIFFRKFYPFRLVILVISRIGYMFLVLGKGNANGAVAVCHGILRGLSKPITRNK